MKELVNFIKNKCSQEEIAELVKELSIKEEIKDNNIPKSWEEYRKSIKKGYYIDIDSEILNVTYDDRTPDFDGSRNVLPTEELAEAFLAMMQLMSLRKAWIKDWEPDWKNISENKYCIVFTEDSPKIDLYCTYQKTLSFSTKEMAEEFLECFKDLIEKAKPLI